MFKKHMQEERHCHCKEKCMYTHTSMHARTQIWLKSSCSGISLTFNFNLFHVCETPAVRCSHTYTHGLNATTLSLSIKPLFAEVSGQNLAWKASTNYSMCVSACKEEFMCDESTQTLSDVVPPPPLSSFPTGLTFLRHKCQLTSRMQGNAVGESKGKYLKGKDQHRDMSREKLSRKFANGFSKMKTFNNWFKIKISIQKQLQKQFNIETAIEIV